MRSNGKSQKTPKANVTFLNNSEKMKGIISNLVETSLLSRQALLAKLVDPRRDYDSELGYPDTISADTYRHTYNRLGLGTRVVKIFPEGCWAMDPQIYETEDPEETEFETEWTKLEKKLNIYQMLHLIDDISGIGRFGILLLGFGDGENLETPMVNSKGKTRTPLLYLRAFDESVVTIEKREESITSPRFGQPILYQVKFLDESGTGTVSSRSKKVHWTRVIHVADGRIDSVVYGTPRMEPVFNRLCDSKKVLGGSGEMFWRGGLPGYSFESQPGTTEADLDIEALKDQAEDWMNGLQRYMSLIGMSVKSLAPQVADPTNHMEAILMDISITLGVPKRVLMGSEEGKLASTQDATSWNTRLKRRQEKYVTPLIIRPFVDRLIATGVLPDIGEDPGYEVFWPDLNAPKDEDKAKVAESKTRAMALYLTSGLSSIFPPAEFLTMVMKMEPEEVESVIKAMEEQERVLEVEGEEMMPTDEEEEVTEEDETRTPEAKGE